MKENNPLVLPLNNLVATQRRLPLLLIAAIALLVLFVFTIRSTDSTLYIPAPVPVALQNTLDGATTTPCIESASNQTTNNSNNNNNKIPRILHHIFLSGYDAFINETNKPGGIIRDWSESCKRLHPHWEYKFWDMDSALELLQQSYPDILPIFNQTRECGIICNPVVLQGDIFRIVALHAFGGLYVDMDVECWLPADTMIDESNADIVLQGTAELEGVTNAIVAGSKGHPIFKKALDLIKERIDDTERTVFEKTGPNLLNDAVLSFKREEEERWRLWEGGEFIITHSNTSDDSSDDSKKRGKNKDDSNSNSSSTTRMLLEKKKKSIVKVYPMGTFFTPCWAFDRNCYARTVVQRGMGKLLEKYDG